MPSSPKHILAYVGALGALALGGSAIANAATSTNPTPAPAAATQAAEQPGTEANDPTEAPGTEAKDGSEKGDTETQVSAADAKQASDAALASVGGGKVGAVDSETPDPNETADTPEKGDTPDPAYEKNAAFQVEVTKADGSDVEVYLDKGFQVLGTQTDKADQNEQGGQNEQDGQNESATEAPAKTK